MADLLEITPIEKILMPQRSQSGTIEQPAKSDDDSPLSISVEVVKDLLVKDSLSYEVEAEAEGKKTAVRVKFEDIDSDNKAPFPQLSEANPGSVGGESTPVAHPELHQTCKTDKSSIKLFKDIMAMKDNMTDVERKEIKA